MIFCSTKDFKWYGTSIRHGSTISKSHDTNYYSTHAKQTFPLRASFLYDIFLIDKVYYENNLYIFVCCNIYVNLLLTRAIEVFFNSWKVLLCI